MVDPDPPVSSEPLSFDRQLVDDVVPLWCTAQPVAGEEAIFRKLGLLARAARDASDPAFAAKVEAFAADLRARLGQTEVARDHPPDVGIVLQALREWVEDTGTQWGEGVIDSRWFDSAAGVYPTVSATQYKCNIFVAEMIYLTTRHVYPDPSLEDDGWDQRGRFYPVQARTFSDPTQQIPGFTLHASPQLGDVVGFGGHVGFYLGHDIYISARDDGDGVHGTDWTPDEVSALQFRHGVQIKDAAGIRAAWGFSGPGPECPNPRIRLTVAVEDDAAPYLAPGASLRLRVSLLNPDDRQITRLPGEIAWALDVPGGAGNAAARLTSSDQDGAVVEWAAAGAVFVRCTYTMHGWRAEASTLVTCGPAAP